MKFGTLFIVTIIGIACANILNSIPPESFAYYMPLCWTPRVDCTKSYPNMKSYMIVVILVFCIWLIPS